MGRRESESREEGGEEGGGGLLRRRERRLANAEERGKASRTHLVIPSGTEVLDESQESNSPRLV